MHKKQSVTFTTVSLEPPIVYLKPPRSTWLSTTPIATLGKHLFGMHIRYLEMP